jgi:hypothetical protein
MHEHDMKKKRIATGIVHSLWTVWENCGGLGSTTAGLLSPDGLVIPLG